MDAINVWLMRGLAGHRSVAYVVAGLGVGGWYLYDVFWRRALRRPFTIHDVVRAGTLEDPQAELANIIEWLQNVIIRPIDAYLPGKPFEDDLLSFPFTPLVLLIGSHSAGKSTFINRLLAERLRLDKDSKIPFGLQIVDTGPRIADDESQSSCNGNPRGKYLEMVRWFGKRADVILLLFEPDKPGAMEEALEILTKSLSGLEDKFLILLNKVDRLDRSMDLARAYGTLAWELSKVIPRKDMPMIYPIYTELHGDDTKHRSGKLSLDAFHRQRDEVIAEVFRSKARHWNNVVTVTEDTLRQLQMVTTVISSVRRRVWRRRREIQLSGTLAFIVPAAGLGMLSFQGTPSVLTVAGITASYLLSCCGYFGFLRHHCLQCERLQVADPDACFTESYKNFLARSDGDDLLACWTTVRSRVVRIFNAVGSAAALPNIPRTRLDWIGNVLDQDLNYLRQIAHFLRSSEL